MRCFLIRNEKWSRNQALLDFFSNLFSPKRDNSIVVQTSVLWLKNVNLSDHIFEPT